jgi:hypothetical protein
LTPARPQVTKGATTVTTTFTIHVDREMNETFPLARHGRAQIRRLSEISFGTPLPTSNRDLIRSAHGRNTLRARGASRAAASFSSPIARCFSRRPAARRVQLTMVEMMLDAKGAGTGTMTGAARVKPTPDGGLVVDVFEVAPVQLTVHRVAEK